jgi:hypothetical protein
MVWALLLGLFDVLRVVIVFLLIDVVIRVAALEDRSVVEIGVGSWRVRNGQPLVIVALYRENGACV